jgi:hypothetical protein
MEKILVFLTRDSRTEEIMPCVETLAKPGMTVVFFVPYPVEHRDYLRDHWMTTELTKTAMLAGRRIVERYSWNTQRQLAEQKLAHVCAALQKKGVSVEVHLYTGSLRKIVLQHGTDEGTRWIITPGRSRVMARVTAPFRWTKPTRLIPVAFLYHKGLPVG